jgi:hypothetical protein
VEEEAKQCHL